MSRRPHRHSIAVRYGEIDQQGVVFNAHYLAYIDDALEGWLDEALGELRASVGWDMMLKRVAIEWQGSLRRGDTVDIDVAIQRWGETSWDVGFVGTCRSQAVFAARVVYVSVRLGGAEQPMVTPAAIRERLGEPLELPVPS
jgi:acyl-CoA thioester hydrolase